MLDVVSLRVSFTVVALTLMVLYGLTYRSTRSAFAAWWCTSLALFVGGASLYLLDGTAHQVWANPLGNAVLVAGIACAWAGSRSLRGLRVPWWRLAVAPVVVWLFSVVDDPGQNVWSGGPYFLGASWILLGLTSFELWRLLGEQHVPDSPDGRSHRLSVWALLVATGGLSVFYLGRWIAFLAVGPDAPPFSTAFGGATTTLITTPLLTTVSFSMSRLSDAQQKHALRELASRDGLTGLLNRSGFVRLAEQAMRRSAREGDRGQVILADLDHFKRINDEHGHLAGDHALVAFADACRGAIRSTDLAGRYGGEEFVLLLVGAGPERARQVTAEIGEALMRHATASGLEVLTASFGIAEVDPSDGLEQNVDRADKALYRAKAEGRNRAVHYTRLVA